MVCVSQRCFLSQQQGLGSRVLLQKKLPLAHLTPSVTHLHLISSPVFYQLSGTEHIGCRADQRHAKLNSRTRGFVHFLMNFTTAVEKTSQLSYNCTSTTVSMSSNESEILFLTS